MPLSKIRTIYRVARPDLHSLITPLSGRPLLDVDLDFRGHETQHSTHAIHPYLAAINPPLARTLIETYVPLSGKILDPFCGGGGVLVEATLAGRAAAGMDINPLAYIISKAKTTHIDYKALRDSCGEVQHIAQASVSTSRPPKDPNLSYWFKEESIQPLAALADATRDISNQAASTLFQVVVSATTRDVMLTYRGEIRLRHLVGLDLERFRPDPFVAFGKRAELAIQRISELPKNAVADVRLADARQLPYLDDSFDAVICSPPYADDDNGVGYFQFSKYMLLWLGWTNEALRKQKRQFLGGARNGYIFEPPPSPTLRRCLEVVGTRNPSHREVAARFYTDYFKCLQEMARVSRKWIVIVIGDRVLSRTELNNGQITYELCRLLGVILDDYYTRSITKKRIKDQGGDGGGITLEHILVFRKN